MKTLTKVLVGSRLHGLANEDSDYDYRGIHMHDLEDVLSPFKTLKNTSWIEGDVDNASYELADFCKQAIHGNATILEVFFSNEIIETSPIADEMRANWRKFIDSDKFLMASRGYAHNQYNKMQLFEGPGLKGQNRTPKFAVAYLRVLWQCARFFETGEFHCQIDDPELRDYMLRIKHDWSDDLVPELSQRFIELQKRVTDAYATAPKMKPDTKWIEAFIHRSYTGSAAAKQAPSTYTPPQGKTRAIICDIDGTIAHMGERSPYDWHKVGTDNPDKIVIDLLRRHDDRVVILLSGRDEVCRSETVQWLAENRVPFHYLHMRPEGDNRKDSIVKRELFEEYIRDHFNVEFVLDDRNQVVDMWRNELGLKVLQVAAGDF